MTVLPPIRNDRRPSLRQATAFVAGAALVIGAVAGWVFFDAAGNDRKPEEQRTAASSDPVTQVVPEAPAAVANTPSEPLSATRSAAGEIEVCGVGWMSLEGDPEAIAARAAQATDERAEQLKSWIFPLMLASSDERTRGAALRFLASSVGAAAPTCSGPQCDVDRGRWQNASFYRDALASLASTSSDPQVYAWAADACAGPAPSDSSACQMVDPGQWARLDPENGVAWLGVARRAEAQHDAAGIDNAMYRLGMASRFDAGFGALSEHLLGSVPAGDGQALGAMSLLIEAIGIEAAAIIPSRGILLNYCRKKQLGDSNRRETCVRIADNLLDHATTMLDWTFGRSLLERVGGTPARLQGVSDQRDAFQATNNGQIEDPVAFDCRTIERYLQRAHDVAQLGEVEMARRAVAKSGKPVASLAAGWRAEIERIAAAKAAEQASSSASASMGASTPTVAIR